MDTMTRGDALQWGHPATSARMKFVTALNIGPFLLGGSGPVHDLPLIEVTRLGVYITFPTGVRPAENDVFRIVRPLWRREDPVLTSGQPRKVVAEVQIVSVRECPRVLVRVLKGSVISGISAERKSGSFQSRESNP